MSEKYILEAKHAVRCDDLMTWARWMDTADRHVGLTNIGPLKVSTVFLGMDHNFFDKGPPLLFETMIFGGAAEDEMIESYQERCSTWEEAEAQHERAITVAKERLQKAEEFLVGHRTAGGH